MANFLVFSLIVLLLHLFTTTTAATSPISAAVEVLSDSGYFSMALTLTLTSPALRLTSFSANVTIFAPSDLAFFRYGQPSLLDLQHQISPMRLAGDSLQKLTYGTRIPSLRSSIPLIITSTGNLGSVGKLVSINDVLVQDSAIFDDGYLVVYATDEFFKPFSLLSLGLVLAPESNPTLPFLSSPNSSSFSSPNSSSSLSNPSSSSLSSRNSSSFSSHNSSSSLSRANSPSGSSTNVTFLSSLNTSSSLATPNSAPRSSPASPADSCSKSPASPSPSLQTSSGSNPSFPANSRAKSPSSVPGYDVDVDVFEKVSSLLMSRGYTIMGTFLGLQLEGFGFPNQTGLTVFAPVDEAVTESVTSFSNYSVIFRAHVIRKLLSWRDFRGLGDGTNLNSALKGFPISVSWSGDILLLNGIPVIFPDMYVSEWIAVHGLNRMIISQSKQDVMGESFSELDGREDDNDDQYSSRDYTEYGARD